MVCKGCFLTALGEIKCFIELAVQNKLSSSDSGIPVADNKGREPPKHKLSESVRDDVKKHIQSFPEYESHYSRKTKTKKYLPSHLNHTKMYEIYKTGSAIPRFSAKDMGKNKTVLEEHQTSAEDEYEKKREEKDKAKVNPSYKVFSFDLQQCLPFPYLNTSVSFYKRQLRVFNLTSHDCATKEVKCFMWHEGIANRGANNIASCLVKLTDNLPRDVKHAVFYSDTCPGKNLNSHVAVMFSCALQRITILQYIGHEFMVPGHTHLECDYDHSAIERQRKKTPVEIAHPRD
ncbi:hypothetical protein PR048_014595 [Dryococelus australis]|uniref:Uncharacterized protein n=1 Tax=Dryococelus australis TaxID=614101 RepID=A0ABQ9HEM6_9NEOP|nr:hypothetical protein PR048_014595 [Dryococelus australis]